VEHLITFQPTGGMVDSEYVVFTGWDPGRDQGADRADRDDRGGAVESVPLTSVPRLIRAGQIWNSGRLVALLRLLMPQG
jgi:hypothetical protein